MAVTSPAKPNGTRSDPAPTITRSMALAELFTPQEEALFEREKIRHEDELLDHRVSWLTTSAAIFITAYVLRFSGGNTMPGPLRVGIPFLGLCTCVLFYMGIKAAIDASVDIERQWNEEHPEYPGVLLAGTPKTRKRGLRSAKFVAPMFAVAWFGTLIYEIYIPL